MPAVVVLHGCGGFGGIDQLLARDLPAHGVATYYIDYFGLTPQPSKRGFCGAHRGVERSFRTWQRVVVDATDALKRMHGIDAARVGAVGWSLGGGLALVTGEYGAATTPVRHSPFHALVVLSAFDESGPVDALPPTLVLSGGSGDAVPVSDARALYRALQRAHVPAVLHVYPHGTHNWKGRQRLVGEGWTYAFLQRYLVRA
jgi:dienelactone hydrolase